MGPGGLLSGRGAPGRAGGASYRWASAIDLIYKIKMVLTRASGTVMASSLKQNKFWDKNCLSRGNQPPPSFCLDRGAPPSPGKTQDTPYPPHKKAAKTRVDQNDFLASKIDFLDQKRILP